MTSVKIRLLKGRLSNETNMLKKVSEERDSYKTALEPISRDINNQRSGVFVEHASNNHRTTTGDLILSSKPEKEEPKKCTSEQRY